MILVHPSHEQTEDARIERELRVAAARSDAFLTDLLAQQERTVRRLVKARNTVALNRRG